MIPAGLWRARLRAWICITACSWTGFANAEKPVIFQVLDPVRPNETLLLFGAGVSTKPEAEGLRLKDTAVDAPPRQLALEPAGKPLPMKVLQASDLSAKVLVPESWAPGVLAVRMRNGDGVSAWQFVNRPSLWWQMSGSGGKLNPGAGLRVFGKNFGPKTRLWLRDAKGVARELPVDAAGENEASASVPATLVPGVYELWLHNGRGGLAGFGEPLEVEVAAAAEKWPAAKFDVRDFGAKGDNRNDDTYAIRRALAWAGRKGGGVVYLPRGTYLVTGKLPIPRRVVLRGEDREAAWIKVPRLRPATQKPLPEFEAVIAGNGEFAVENLSIIAQPVQRIVAAPDLPEMYGPGTAKVPMTTPSADGVRLRGLRLWHLYFANRLGESDPSKQTNEGPSAVAVKGADFSLENSEIVGAGMPIQILDATRAKISGNTLRTGRGWYGLWDFRDGIFEKNDISAGDLLGSFGGVQRVAANVMFSRNHWHHAFGGEREALTFDTPYTPVWMGSVEGNGTSLRLDRQDGGKDLATTRPEDLLAVVAGGRGVGQAVPVTKNSGRAVEIARVFAVAPNRKSTIVLGIKKTHVLVVDNVIEDASVAVQLYAQAHEFFIARNRCLRTGGSYSHGYDVMNSAGEHGYSYSLFNQWIDNTFEDGLVFDQGPWPDAYVGYSSQRSSDFTETTPVVGNRLVGNRLLGGTQMGATNVPGIPAENLFHNLVPLARDGIFEHNRIAHQAGGITVDPGHWFTFLRENFTTDVRRPFQDQGVHTIVQ